MLRDLGGRGYEEMHRRFRWRIPEPFNIAEACADRQDPRALALVEVAPTGRIRELSFGELGRAAAALAGVLTEAGVERGGRVGIVLHQGVESAVAHLGIMRMGGVAVPLSVLFGPDALAYRLADSDATVLVTDPSGQEKVLSVADELPDLRLVLVAGPEGDGPEAASRTGMAVTRFWGAVEAAASSFDPVPTGSDEPALLVYTSGTTGPPKGALHSHRFLFGSFPAVELVHWPLPQPDDLFWTPADWAWVAALMDVVLPAWYFGLPVLATPRGKFDPEWALDVMARHRVANAYLPPTALKMLRQADPRSKSPALRAVMTGGEALGPELLEWGREALGVTIEETYGQTEANLTVGNASRFWPVRPGSMGRAYPGHEVRVRRDDGTEAAPGELGEVAVRTPDPATFLGYWRRPRETRDAFHGRWLRSGDFARRDEDGYLWFHGREDDLINSAGHRIGPVEIEECLLRHPAVGMAAVIGVPDPDLGQAVKAFVVLRPGASPSPDLEEAIRRFARERVGAHQYPRRIEFIDRLPLTPTGKVRRRDLRETERASGEEGD